MRKSFYIPLLQQKVKPPQVTALHLFLLFVCLAVSAVLVFMFFGAERLLGSFYEKQKLPRAYFYIPPLILITSFISLLIIIFRNKQVTRLGKLNKTLRALEIIMLSLLMFWALSQQIVPLILLFGMAIGGVMYALYTEAGGKLQDQIHLSSEGIWVPSLLKSKKKWEDVERLIIRHGTLSITYADKKFQQWLIAEITEAHAVENFAQEQIEAHRHKRTADW